MQNEVNRMNKEWYQSKTIQGLIIAVLGGLILSFGKSPEMAKTLITLGLGYAGIGARVAAN